MNDTNALKRVGLDILARFADVCRREGLMWYAMFGTLLGASRHGGFIPWDDDIDVAMPRADYDRLRGLAERFPEPYFLQTPQSDPAAAPRFARLMRLDTALIKGYPNGLTRGGHMGAYIDILPLDGVPGAHAAYALHTAARRMQKQMLATAALDEHAHGAVPSWKEEFCYGFGGIAGCYPLLAERYERLCARYGGERYLAIPVMGGGRGVRLYDKAWFAGREEMRFEDTRVYAPSGWREVLVASYPEGLLEPEAGARVPHMCGEGVIADMERPYTDYTRRYTDMLSGIGNQRVIVFGAGDSLRVWLERFGRGSRVVCALDNAPHKWGTKAYGVPVRPPRDLPALLEGGGTRVIIASLYHREIGAQLAQMGVNDYYVFVDGWDYRGDSD